MRHFLTTLLFVLCLGATAQTNLIPDMKFRRLDTPQGLSSSQINNIFKDSRGYVWISTPYGLNRYDGYRVKTFYSNQRDTTTMRDNYCDRVYEAHDGRLWMRQGMGYCVYDPVTEMFERNATKELAKLGLDCGVEWLYIDSKRRIWVKDFEKAIYCFHPGAKGDKKIVKINIGYAQNEFSPDYGISSVAELGDWLLVVTFNGELVCLNGEKGEVDWVDPWMHNTSGIENQEYRLFVDHNGNYWCNVLSFMFVYDKAQKKWYGSLKDYLASKGIADFPGNLQMWGMLVDKNDWLWLICDHDGLVVVDLKNKQWKQFLNNKHDETSLSDNTLRTIYLDNNNTVWIGTFKNGVDQFIPGVSSLRSLELGDITTTCEDKYGNYWLGTNDIGILVYNPKTNEVVNHFTKDNSGLANNIIVGSWPASDGTIWFGSYNGGLTRAIPSASDPTQATIVNIQATGKPGELANNSVWALNEDKWGRIWISTLGGGLQMLDLKTNKFTTWDSKNTVIPGDYLNSLSWNKKGWLMVGSAYYYSLVNPVNHKLINQVIPEDPNVAVNPGSTTYVIEDSRGLLWHGSNVGIIVYDQKTKFQTLLDMTDGLFGSSVNSLLEDKKHNIWAVTDHGVSRIVPQQQENGEWQFTIRSYNSADGLQKATYNQRSMWLTCDGKVLVGGQGGLDIINPSQLQDARGKERPVFSGLQIFDQDVQVGRKFKGRVILDEALDVCRDITLKYNDQFTIQLATNEVSVNNRKRFAYKLEGFNEDWVKTSELNPNITYNSLRAGSYKLCVRVLNGDGTLGEEESQMEISIRPPLWRTRWMLLLYMLLIAGAAWLFVKWYLKKQKERAELETLQREQDKRQWMSEMRTQMRKEAMRSQTNKTDDQSMEVIHESELVDDDTVLKPALPEIKIHRAEGDIVAVLKNLCDNFKPAEDKKLKMSFNSTLESINMSFDEEQIRKAVEILLTNSVKFGPSLCKVQMTVLRPSSERVALLLADNGIGIPEASRAHMFEPYIGEDSEDEGLGLDVVKQIVDAHHGTIKADDNPGGGTVFTISLPIEDPEIEEAVIIEDE
jgi:ligand-binding sensor domain-containing protein